jgi:hypothetical protein
MTSVDGLKQVGKETRRCGRSDHSLEKGIKLIDKLIRDGDFLFACIDSSFGHDS